MISKGAVLLKYSSELNGRTTIDRTDYRSTDLKVEYDYIHLKVNDYELEHIDRVNEIQYDYEGYSEHIEGTHILITDMDNLNGYIRDFTTRVQADLRDRLKMIVDTLDKVVTMDRLINDT